MSAPVEIVHDWLTSINRGERVVEALFRVLPQSEPSTGGRARNRMSATNGVTPANTANGLGHAAAVCEDPSVGSIRHSQASLSVKRLADLTLAAFGLALTAPLLAALATLIPIDSPGPALFRQHRTGLHQRPFMLLKLRTMDERGRVTRMGRMLRPTGLDELPQLLNVLRGDMSLIGPRPEIPERVERFAECLPGFRLRHEIRPGITGWAQVNGLRGNVSIAERLRFDLQYLRERSILLDGQILVRTVSTVLRDTIRELRD